MIKQRTPAPTRRRSAGGLTAYIGRMPNIVDFENDLTSQAETVDRSVAVVYERAINAITPLQSKKSAAPVPATVLRAALLDTFPGEGFAGVLTVLEDDAAVPAVDTVDRLVALGSSLVDSPDAVGTDHILFAVALHLRGLVDSGGWGAADEGSDDVRAAGASLLKTGDALVAAPPDVVAVALRLAAVLDNQLPGCDIGIQISEKIERRNGI